MPSLTGIVKDVRALGSSAPVRAVYEASKRTNGHALLFRPVAGGHRSVPLPFGDRIPESATARERCLEDARLIIDEGTRVFGTRAATGSTASWAMDPLTQRCWPEETPWWQIDIRTDARLSDVKWVWEAARHRDLVVLARATTLDPEGPWLDHLEAMLIRWCRECRPEQGVNWYSSLELALRAIAWSQVLRLVGDRLHGGLRAELDDQLVASARHIMVELPYTLSSMKNNHLLGDGLGLVVLGKMFPGHPGAARWRSVGDRLMLKQLERHMLPDGSMIEDSLSYHRFVLEMFIVRVLVGDAPQEIATAMRSAAEHLAAIGSLDGPVPQYGDWDEGRVLADSAPPGDVAGAAHLALHLSGEPTPEDAWRDYDELAWHAELRTTPPAGGTGSRPPAGRRAAQTWASGQLSGAEQGSWKVWLKQTFTPSHGHADVSSVWIQHDGAWVVLDPGTGTYNGPLLVRNGFRTSAAHSMWRPEGGDLFGPHRAFRWEHRRAPGGYAHLDLPGASLLAVWHEGFDTGRFLRLVVVDPLGVTVLDRLPEGAKGWVMTVPEGPASHLLTGVDGEVVSGSEQPFVGWLSSTYGQWHPSPWREVRGDAGWHVWGAGRSRTVDRTSPDGVDLSSLELTLTESENMVTIGARLEGKKHCLEVPRV